MFNELPVCEPPLARLFLEPLLRAWSAMRAARPTTGSAFTRLKFLDRALNSAAARCFLLGRDNPTNPLVPRQRRQILPCRLRSPFRAQRRAQVRRSHVHGSGLARFAFVHLSVSSSSSAGPFVLPALARHGESGARARLASRISVEDAHRSVATPCGNLRSNATTPISPTLMTRPVRRALLAAPAARPSRPSDLNLCIPHESLL